MLNLGVLDTQNFSYVNQLVLYNNFIIELLSRKIEMKFVFMHMQLWTFARWCHPFLAPCLCFRVNVNYVVIELGDYGWVSPALTKMQGFRGKLVSLFVCRHISLEAEGKHRNHRMCFRNCLWCWMAPRERSGFSRVSEPRAEVEQEKSSVSPLPSSDTQILAKSQGQALQMRGWDPKWVRLMLDC